MKLTARTLVFSIIAMVLVFAGPMLIAVDDARLWATLVGSAAVLIVTAIAEPFSKKYAAKAGVTHY